MNTLPQLAVLCAALSACSSPNSAPSCIQQFPGFEDEELEVNDTEVAIRQCEADDGPVCDPQDWVLSKRATYCVAEGLGLLDAVDVGLPVVWYEPDSRQIVWFLRWEELDIEADLAYMRYRGFSIMTGKVVWSDDHVNPIDHDTGG